MKHITILASMLLVCTIMFAVSGCKKGNNPLKEFEGTYTVNYHEHSTVPGAPPPSGVCDSSGTMTVTLETIDGDDTRLKCILEQSKLYCQSQNLHLWCFAAFTNSTGQLSGSNFVEFCDGVTQVTVNSSTLTVAGPAISCNVNYGYMPTNTGPTLPTGFDFEGTKN